MSVTARSGPRGEDLVRAFFNGYGALFFCPRPLSGALCLLGTVFGAGPAGAVAVVGVIVATVTASALRRPRVHVDAGLYGYCGALVAFAVLNVTGLGDGVLLYTMPAAAATTLVAGFFLQGPWVRRLNLPVLSWPALLVAFPLLIWLTSRPGISVLPEVLPPAWLTRDDLFRADLYSETMGNVVRSIANDWPGKLFFLVGMALHSRRLVVLALAGAAWGSVVGGVFLGWWGALQPTWVTWCAAPVFVALAGVFTAGGRRSIVLGLAGVVIAFFAWFWLGQVLGDRGLPVLTLPLVLTVTPILLVLRLVPHGRTLGLPRAVPLIHSDTPEQAARWGHDSAAGWRYWHTIAALRDRPWEEFARPARIRRARELIRTSQRILVLTGAGISTESGIPDYRTGAIAWKRYDTSHFQWDRFLASEESRRRYWEMSQDFFLVLRTAKANAGHRAIAELDRRGKLLTIVTQNVDRLHQQAGVPAERVIELHGNEHRVSCLNCGRAFAREDIYRRVLNGAAVPHCPGCQGLLKPDSVAFGQPMPVEPSKRALEAAQHCDLVIIAGTSMNVQPVSTLPLVALRAGARLMIVNLEPTELDPFAEVTLRGPLGVLLPEIVRVV